MTKQMTVELLQKQLPGFYSVDQVIKMINDIEDGGSFDEEKVDELKDLISTKVRSALERLNSSDWVDFDSAELELNGNEVSVYDISVNEDSIIDEVNDAVGKAFEKFFQPQETQTA
jgi:transcription initiation factor IIE alpha subunit